MALIASVSYVSINFQHNRLQSSETLIHDLSQDIKVPYFGQKIQQIDICRFKSEGEDSKKSS